jgi:SpoVK/Ycf46/Vps4 family AAA+-type ATPase
MESIIFEIANISPEITELWLNTSDEDINKKDEDTKKVETCIIAIDEIINAIGAEKILPIIS